MLTTNRLRSSNPRRLDRKNFKRMSARCRRQSELSSVTSLISPKFNSFKNEDNQRSLDYRESCLPLLTCIFNQKPNGTQRKTPIGSSGCRFYGGSVFTDVFTGQTPGSTVIQFLVFQLIHFRKQTEEAFHVVVARILQHSSLQNFFVYEFMKA